MIIEELGRTCEEYAHRLEYDPERLQSIQTREAELEWLLKKYRYNVLEELIAHRNELKDQVTRIDNYEAEIKSARDKFEESKSHLTSGLRVLSNHRQKAAGKFELDMRRLLEDVGLKNARFEVKIEQEKRTNGEIEAEKAAISYLITASILSNSMLGLIWANHHDPCTKWLLAVKSPGLCFV